MPSLICANSHLCALFPPLHDEHNEYPAHLKQLAEFKAIVLLNSFAIIAMYERGLMAKSKKFYFIVEDRRKVTQII